MWMSPRLRLLLWMYKKGEVTRKDQPYFMSSIGYYLAISYLKKRGLIEVNRKKGNTKYWKLTEKGRRLAKLLIELEKVVENG